MNPFKAPFLGISRLPGNVKVVAALAVDGHDMNYSKGMLRLALALSPDQQDAFEHEVVRLQAVRAEAVHRAHVAYDEALRQLFLKATPAPTELQLTQKQETADHAE